MIVLGPRFSDRVTCNANLFSKLTKIIHIDIDPAEIGKNIAPYCKVNGDIEYILAELAKKMPAQNHSEWMSEIADWKKEYPLLQVSDDSEAVLPQYVLNVLDELTNGEAIITTEVGQHQMWSAQYYNFKNQRSFASSGGLGTMGYGLGAAIGSKAGNPDKTVVNVAGDGSFYMNLNEISTLAKYRLPVIELLFENNVLGMVRQWQRLFYDKRFSQTTLDKGTDYMKLAEAFGINGLKITKKSEVRDVLKKAIELNAPVLIECVINKDINVLPMVPAGKSVAEPILDIVIDD